MAQSIRGGTDAEEFRVHATRMLNQRLAGDLDVAAAVWQATGATAELVAPAAGTGTAAAEQQHNGADGGVALFSAGTLAARLPPRAAGAAGTAAMASRAARRAAADSSDEDDAACRLRAAAVTVDFVRAGATVPSLLAERQAEAVLAAPKLVEQLRAEAAAAAKRAVASSTVPKPSIDDIFNSDLSDGSDDSDSAANNDAPAASGQKKEKRKRTTKKKKNNKKAHTKDAAEASPDAKRRKARGSDADTD